MDKEETRNILSVAQLKNLKSLLLFLLSLLCGYLLTLREALLVPFLCLILKSDLVVNHGAIDEIAQSSFILIFVGIGEMIGALLTHQVNARFGKKRVS